MTGAAETVVALQHQIHAHGGLPDLHKAALPGVGPMGNHSRAAIHTAFAAQVKDNPALVLQHLHEAIRLDPYYAPAYHHLGCAYREKGLFEEAVSMYRTALTLKPDLAETHAQLASTYKDTNRMPEATAHYRKALELQPGMPDALCNLVHTYVFTADWRDYEANMASLERCIDEQLAAGVLPAAQPFHAFVYPISLHKVRDLAASYAARAEQVARGYVAAKQQALQLRQPQLAADCPPYAHRRATRRSACRWPSSPRPAAPSRRRRGASASATSPPTL